MMYEHLKLDCRSAFCQKTCTGKQVNVYLDLRNMSGIKTGYGLAWLSTTKLLDLQWYDLVLCCVFLGNPNIVLSMLLCFGACGACWDQQRMWYCNQWFWFLSGLHTSRESVAIVVTGKSWQKRTNRLKSCYCGFCSLEWSVCQVDCC